MNLPLLIQQLYGEFQFTGLYSFEFVDRNRNTITEVFFMCPPKGKTVSEPTRSSTIPTLGGNYNVDGGNATKMITLSGDLYFPYIGSPDNPIARNNNNLENTLSGLEEFLKLRWMLIRYRDYTITTNSKISIPSSIIGVSKEINALYKKVSKQVKEQSGALLDEIKLIFHDYDMDDHFYCRIDNFTSTQSDAKYIAIDYNISIECYEPDDIQSTLQMNLRKQTTNESLDISSKQLELIQYDEAYDDIQAEIGSNSSFIAVASTVELAIDNIIEENENIQAGKSTASSFLPIYNSTLLASTESALDFFINTFLTSSQKTDYEVGDITIDDFIDKDLLVFYNILQKIKLQAESIQGILNSIPKFEDIRYSVNADDYTLTEEQFDSDDASKVENTANFYYYTVLEGDTSRIIALRELNDQEKFVNILKINNITENNFIDGEIVGEQIKIPIDKSVVTRGDDNLVYETDLDNIENFIFGKDINVSLNKELVASATGDLLALDGIENAYKNIENRIDSNKGSLNVFNPNYGTISIDESNAPLYVKIDRYLTDIVSQIQSDPRVSSVQLDLKSLQWVKDSVSVSTKIFFIGNENAREVTV